MKERVGLEKRMATARRGADIRGDVAALRARYMPLGQVVPGHIGGLGTGGVHHMHRRLHNALHLTSRRVDDASLPTYALPVLKAQRGVDDPQDGHSVGSSTPTSPEGLTPCGNRTSMSTIAIPRVL